MNSTTTTRFKLAALILLSTVFVLVRNIFVIGLACGAIIAVSGAKMHRGSLKSRLISITAVSVLVILFQLLFNGSVAVYERLLIGIMTALRLIALSFLVLLFTETTSPSAIIAALSFLPKKITLMLTISFSLIPAILQEISAIRIVQEARGFSSRGLNVFRSIFPVLIPLLNRTLTRAEHIAMVLQTRGYE